MSVSSLAMSLERTPATTWANAAFVVENSIHWFAGLTGLGRAQADEHLEPTVLPFT